MALVLGALALGSALVLGGRSRAAGAAVAIAAAGAFQLGSLRVSAEALRPLRPVEATVEARVAAVRATRSGQVLELDQAVSVLAHQAAVPRRIRLLLRPPREQEIPGVLRQVLPGDRVRARLRLRAPGGLRNPGSRFDPEADLRRGVGAIAQPVHPLLAERLEAGRGPAARVAKVRRRIDRRLVALGPGGALLSALAVGERGHLDAATRAAFARLGLAHLLAVSGLHLVLVAVAAYAALRGVAVRLPWAHARDARRGGAVATLILLAGYAALAGLGLPVRRALLMATAAVAALLRGRATRREQPLVLAAILLLALEPGALFAAGAWLSFAAAAALVLAPASQAPEARGLTVLRTSATALLATAPLVAGRLGGGAPLALPANALAVPWAGAVLLPAALGAAGLVGIAPEGSLVAELARGPERLAAASLAAVRAVAGAAPIAGPGHVPAPAFLLAATALAAWGLTRRSTRARLLAAVAQAVLLALAPPAQERPVRPRLVTLDVGQGDAVLVEGNRGALLVDAGSRFADSDRGRDAVVPALAALGIRRLDALAVSHGDLDHRGGAPAVLRAVPVAAVWLPSGAVADPAFDAVRRAAREAGAPVRELAAGALPLRLGDLRVDVLWPPPDGEGNRNHRSLVLRVAIAGARVLLAGDIDARAETRLVASGADLQADVLKLAHHGSRTSSTPEFLEAVAGAVAIVSAPCHGRFAMPHAGVVSRVRGAGYALWWTGRDGAVAVSLGAPPWVRGFGLPRCRLPRGGSQEGAAGGRSAARRVD